MVQCEREWKSYRNGEEQQNPMMGTGQKLNEGDESMLKNHKHAWKRLLK